MRCPKVSHAAGADRAWDCYREMAKDPVPSGFTPLFVDISRPTGELLRSSGVVCLAKGGSAYDYRRGLLFSCNPIPVTPKAGADGHDGVLAGLWRDSIDGGRCGAAREFQFFDCGEFGTVKRRRPCHG